MAQTRWIRLIVITAILGVAILATGYRLTRSETAPAMTDLSDPAAVRLAETRSIAAQMTTIEEALARQPQVPAEQMVVFTNEMYDYHLDYPLGWHVTELSPKTSLFQSPDGESWVEVEAVGILPVDGLAAFVDRSIRDELVMSHQLLTIHGQPAERVVAYSTKLEAQQTSFYIDSDASAFVITGSGEQRLVEMIARSFNAPQLVAQR